MILDRKKILILMLVPVIALLGMLVQRVYLFNLDNEVTLKIEGYDPRDLLSGHYLIYRVLYDVPNVCYNTASKFRKAGYICLDDKRFDYKKPTDCQQLIKGSCARGRFKAGIEKFYVPEKEAKAIEKLVIEKRGSLLLSLSVNGKTQIKELLIDGKPWKQVVK